MSTLKAQFDELGFVVIRDLMVGGELEELSRMADRLLDGELKPDLAYNGKLPDEFYTFWEPGMKDRHDLPRRLRVRLMSWMCYHQSWFWAFACRPQVCEPMAELFGGKGVQIFSDTVFMKPPFHGMEAAPHQDTAFWPKLRPKALLFWMAIDPADQENGCLHVIPGSQRTDLPHHKDPVQSWLLKEEQLDLARQVPVELAAGSAIFMDSSLVHRSYPNRGPRSRRAMTSVYVSADVAHLEPWTYDYRFKPIPAGRSPTLAGAPSTAGGSNF